MAFFVEVLDNDGDGVEGVEVTLFFRWLRGGTNTMVTDDDGIAAFEGYEDGQLSKIVIDGDSYDKNYYYQNGETVTVYI